MSLWKLMQLGALRAPADDDAPTGGASDDDADAIDVDIVDDDADADSDPDPAPPAKTAKTVNMPTAAIAKIRKEERTRGQRIAAAAQRKAAADLGYDSYEEMIEAAKSARTRSRGGRPAAPPDALTVAQTRIVELETALKASKLAERKARMSAVTADKKRRAALERVAVREVEMELTQLASKCGVRDPEYAIQRMRKHCKGLDEAGQLAFNEADYFSNKLKQEAPFLFQAEEVPAGTVTPAAKAKVSTPGSDALIELPSGGAPPAGGSPIPGEAQTTTTPDDGTVDARKLSTAEYHAFLKANKLNRPDGSAVI